MNYAIGTICALISAISFGLIALFSVPLLNAGLHFNNVIFYRYLFASAFIGIFMLLRKKSLKIDLKDLPLLGVLSLVNVACSILIVWGYDLLDSGLATSIYFLYPVFVVVAMVTFFGEKKSIWIGVSIFLAVFGVSLLSGGGSGKSSPFGIGVVIASSLCYALFIIGTNKTKANTMDPLLYTFYVLLIGAFYTLAIAIGTENVQMFPVNWSDMLSLGGLVLFSTVVSNLTLIEAIRRIGSTMTSIMGALQPLVAVAVGIWVFKEPFTSQIIYSTACIIASVVIIIVAKNMKNPRDWDWSWIQKWADKLSAPGQKKL